MKNKTFLKVCRSVCILLYKWVSVPLHQQSLILLRLSRLFHLQRYYLYQPWRY